MLPWDGEHDEALLLSIPWWSYEWYMECSRFVWNSWFWCHPFICKCTDNEGCFVFSFNMDGFNPFQLKQAERSASVMELYMVCLNLPPEACFKLENMFLAGIIPGSKEPSKKEINHFLRLLINDLLKFYIDDIYYTCMWKYLKAWNTRSDLALIICNLLAAHQTLGFIGPQSTNSAHIARYHSRTLATSM